MSQSADATGPSRCHGRRPKTHRMILIADCREAPQATPRSRRLGFCLDADYDPDDFTYEVCPGDGLTVEVFVPYPEDDAAESYEVFMFNLVSWRGYRRRNQVFSGLLRSSGDSPDERILADGIPHFSRSTPRPLDAEAFAGQSQLCLLPAEPYAVFTMAEPARLILDRPGLFAFLVSVTIRRRLGEHGPGGEEPLEQFFNFIIDPELDVGGTYPPD